MNWNGATGRGCLNAGEDLGDEDLGHRDRDLDRHVRGDAEAAILVGVSSCEWVWVAETMPPTMISAMHNTPRRILQRRICGVVDLPSIPRI